ncbi:hypothetical protein BJV78DRAFT_498365 [Lactifluus subvellereus]|nr:hypothetical protein BJV78DRAFT_498365 [Lactifluus subvellereus]
MENSAFLGSSVMLTRSYFCMSNEFKCLIFSCRDCEMSSNSPLHNEQHIIERHEYRPTASHETADQVATTALQYVLLPNSMPLLRCPHPTPHIPNPSLTKSHCTQAHRKRTNQPFRLPLWPITIQQPEFLQKQQRTGIGCPHTRGAPSPAPGSRMTIVLALAFASPCVARTTAAGRARLTGPDPVPHAPVPPLAVAAAAEVVMEG